MKRFTFSLLCLSVALTGLSTTWTVNNAGFTFNPATITIAEGDTVIFAIENIHTVLEVSQATWDANGNTPLPGGFSLPLGGGMLLPDDLPVGTHWYVCEPHAEAGMKGMIIVEGVSATDEPQRLPDISLFPNPTQGTLQLLIENRESSDPIDLEIYDAQGRQVYSRSNVDPWVITEIDLSYCESGFYLMKLYAGSRTYNRKIVIQ